MYITKDFHLRNYFVVSWQILKIQIMKRIILSSLSILLFFACGKKEDAISNQYTISGTMANADSAWVILQKRDNGAWVKIDSAQVIEKAFKIAGGSVEIPEMFYLQVDDKRNYMPLFLENSDITFDGDLDSLDNAVIAGSAIHAKYEAYQEGKKPFNDKMIALYPKYDLADSLGDKEMEKLLDEQYEAIYEEQKVYTMQIIAKNSDNNMGPYLASSTFFNDEDAEDLHQVLADFDSTLNESSYVKTLTKMAATWKLVAVGQPAVDFTQNDSTDAPINLASFKGQYLLIDFWASWCGPCRQENPNVVRIYDDLHDKGFEILGVSFDTSREKWLKAIADDQLTWPHVSDLKGWSNAVGALYGVRSIPHTVLIDKEGTIIAKNLRGDDLRDKLEELLL